jgi:hypothetical protein
MNTWRFPVLVKHGMVNPAPILKSGLREKSVLQFSFMRWACIQLSAVLSPLKYRRNSLGVLIDIIKILDHILSTFRVFFFRFRLTFLRWHWGAWSATFCAGSFNFGLCWCCCWISFCTFMVLMFQESGKPMAAMLNVCIVVVDVGGG